MIPLRDTVPRVTRPYLVVAIIAVNALVFLYTQTMPAMDKVYLYHLLGVVPARFFQPGWAAWAGYPDTWGYPLVTYMFLHGGWMHVIMNMWMLWIFGDNIEDVTGHAKFAIFYILCGLAAVGLHMAFEQTSPTPIVGASGAVAGVMGAYIVLYPHGRVLTLIPIFIYPLIVRVPAALFLGVWFATQLLSGLYSASSQAAHGVAWWAHVGGFIAGIVLINHFRKPGACVYCYDAATKDYQPSKPDRRQ